LHPAKAVAGISKRFEGKRTGTRGEERFNTEDTEDTENTEKKEEVKDCARKTRAEESAVFILRAALAAQSFLLPFFSVPSVSSVVRFFLLPASPPPCYLP
jgi:hypothetical protein